MLYIHQNHFFKNKKQMDKRFKIISTDMDYVVKAVNYHVSHGYSIIKVDSGRAFFIGPKYMSFTLERPDADVIDHKKTLLQRAIERQDFEYASRLRDELNNN